jgi:hypothetical protein
MSLLLSWLLFAVAAFAIADLVAAVCPLLLSAIVIGASPVTHGDFAANITKIRVDTAEVLRASGKAKLQALA